jgi:hypothetical protein
MSKVTLEKCGFEEWVVGHYQMFEGAITLFACSQNRVRTAFPHEFKVFRSRQAAHAWAKYTPEHGQAVPAGCRPMRLPPLWEDGDE